MWGQHREETRDERSGMTMTNEQQQQPATSSESGVPPLDSTAETLVANEETASLIERLTQERDEAVIGYKRALADFANFQRRANDNELRARDGGVIFVARTLMPVLDSMDLSLAQNSATLTVEQMLQAIAMLRTEMNRAMEKSGIVRIDPKRGDEFDPHLHEAVMQQAVEGVESGRITATFQVGYMLGDSRLRAAKVSVAP
jgi:molecular chaperone GrpE